MKNENKKLEKILNQALELYENGKSVPEILNLFPEYKDKLREIFQIIETLVKGKERIVLPKELLNKIILEITSKESVTKKEFSRYLYYRDYRGKKEPEFSGIKGRPSLINKIKNQYTMAKNWKILIPIGVLILVAVAVVITQFIGKPQKGTSPATTEESLLATPSPVEPAGKSPVETANVDDVVNALFTDSLDEITQISQGMDDDIELIGLDSQAISDFGQSYNENDF